ncbi:MAG: GxxExxY protein [Kiritimatiellales bacterium]|nr:GxxExxY protein [Kiritimatiellota bacterium]MBL7016165.1 GxxExxY protein [Kiritimatiellales bacterium]
MSDELFKEEGYQLMGAAFEVYNEQGCHLSEDIYQASMEQELAMRGLPFDPQRHLNVFYKGIKLEPKFIPDLFVFDEIIVELKAVKKLLPEHEAQLINYLAITGKKVGYLINFGHQGSLEWKRIVL